MKKKQVNLPLVEVLVGSLLLHIVAGVILGGLVLYQSLQEPEPEFVPPPEIKRVQPEKLEYKVKMQQQQKQSAKPRMKRIQVESPTNISVPQIDIVAPNVSSEVAVGTGMGGGSGSGNGLGNGGSLGLGKVSVKFFGIKNAGEKVMFVVDASKYMLEDHKGGYPAYSIVKAEITNMINKIPDGLLFNVAVYSGVGVNFFKPDKMIPKTPGVAREVADWIAPINNSASSAGRIGGNGRQMMEFAPMGKNPTHWVRALIQSFEMQPDTIFMIDGHWKWHSWNLDPEAKKQWLLGEGWNDKRMAQFKVNEQKAHEWLRNENAKRRSAGVPERVVHWIGEVVREMGNEVPPDPHYGIQDIQMTLNAAIKHYYKSQGLRKPSINIVLFQGPEEADSGKGQQMVEDFKHIAKRVGARGRFKKLEGMRGLQNVTSARPEEALASTL